MVSPNRKSVFLKPLWFHTIFHDLGGIFFCAKFHGSKIAVFLVKFTKQGFIWNPSYGEFWPKNSQFWALKPGKKKIPLKFVTQKNSTFGFKIKKFETNLKPLWVSKKLTKNQIYILKSDFDNEKLHVFEKITRPIFQKKTCLFFEDMNKKWQVEQKCANFIKNCLVSN